MRLYGVFRFRLGAARLLVARVFLTGVFLIIVLHQTPVEASTVEWLVPVDAPVVDPFRPPASRFAPGNRGIEYGTAGGEDVVAVAAGQVGYIGRIGSSQFVVVDHEGSLRSTYAFVQQILVVRGQHVTQGEPIALAGPGFHLTARLGDEYVDPAGLFSGADLAPHLVDNPATDTGGAGGPLPLHSGGVLDSLRATVAAASDLALTEQIEAIATAAEAWTGRPCTDESVVVPEAPGPRTLIQVGGLGSSSSGASIGDLSTVAYGEANVIGFSYRGGCTPVSFGSPGVGGDQSALANELASSAYGPSDTHQSIEVSAVHLADLIQAAASARPGRPIDVAAHSLGGVVARRAVEVLAERGRLGRSADALPLAVVMTIGSPHGGADLATMGLAIEGSDLAGLVDGLTDYRQADAVSQLAEAGLNALDPPGPPPPGITVVAVAGATDVIVPADKAIWSGARNVLIPTGPDDGIGVHGQLPGHAGVARELALATAGMAPGCVDLANVVSSALTARAISSAEDLATVLLGIGRYVI